MNNKAKILYVDDEAINLTLFEINFKQHYDVYTAENGSKGLEILKENPDTLIIVSDMKMPGMNGIEFIKKAKEQFPNKKYFILTGFEINDEITHAIESGLIIKYFRKPFNIKDIQSSIDSAIAQCN
ncbi:response regulator [Carboxylicivirga sp. N1Y90]|uniref:response regulator n=1 Tax=Carboxylicivirga fragile TaxID=3417571 RepID=UPI003D331E7F|nr:response regulator [Marinilabiliaceae bacterium N1Y90]